jgi:hypothetical protein
MVAGIVAMFVGVDVLKINVNAPPLMTVNVNPLKVTKSAAVMAGSVSVRPVTVVAMYNTGPISKSNAVFAASVRIVMPCFNPERIYGFVRVDSSRLILDILYSFPKAPSAC